MKILPSKMIDRSLKKLLNEGFYESEKSDSFMFSFGKSMDLCSRRNYQNLREAKPT
jgi:hypothetical protein